MTSQAQSACIRPACASCCPHMPSTRAPHRAPVGAALFTRTTTPARWHCKSRPAQRSCEATLRFDPLQQHRLRRSLAPQAAAGSAGQPAGNGQSGGGGESAAAGGADSAGDESRQRSGVGSSASEGGKGASSGGEDIVSWLQSTGAEETESLPEPFCIIESRDSVKNFASMQLAEIRHNLTSRRNRIFLLMEEVRRLRIQQRLKGDVRVEAAEELLEDQFPSVIPFFPPISQETLQDYFRFYLIAVAFIVGFGGLLAPVAEVKLGLGGTSYPDFITSVHLPAQLAQVDPIVASFCGGAVGVLSTLMILETNNAKVQDKRRCFYCEGTGYLTCGGCVGTGEASPGESCPSCQGIGKVMCTACLCTGKKLATEHDPRIDPFV